MKKVYGKYIDVYQYMVAKAEFNSATILAHVHYVYVHLHVW